MIKFRVVKLVLLITMFYSYQFNPAHFRLQTVALILMKALTNLPHTDFTLCKCLLDPLKVSHY